MLFQARLIIHQSAELDNYQYLFTYLTLDSLLQCAIPQFYCE